MGAEGRVGVAIADGQTLLVDAIAEAIDATPDLKVVLVARCGEELLGRFTDGAPVSVVVVACVLPDLDGIEVVRRLKLSRENPDLRVLVYAEHADPWLARRALQTGADGFLSKDSHLETLLQAIRSVAAGNVYLTADLARVLAAGEDGSRLPHELLSPREAEVFMLIANGRTTTEIALETYLDQRTVSTYRRRILDKLGLDRNSEVVAYAIRHGLVG